MRLSSRVKRPRRGITQTGRTVPPQKARSETAAHELRARTVMCREAVLNQVYRPGIAWSTALRKASMASSVACASSACQLGLHTSVAPTCSPASSLCGQRWQWLAAKLPRAESGTSVVALAVAVPADSKPVVRVVGFAQHL